MRARRAGGSALVAAAVAGFAMGGAESAEAAAAAAPKARVSVTIQAEGTDLSGVVRSSRPAVCAADRTVVVFQVRGRPGGGDDLRFASDTTDLSGGRYTWSTGNTGTEGRFYAKVRATSQCRGAISAVVRARRSD